MSAETLSMRKTAQELEISTVRVRELIKKGRLDAEKVSDEAGDRWEISRASIEAFRRERRDDTSNGSRPAPTKGGGTTNPHLGALLPELEQQLDRVKALIEEIARAQAYLDGLRETQRRLEKEIASARARTGGSSESSRPESSPQQSTGSSPSPSKKKPDGQKPEAKGKKKPEGKKSEGKKSEADDKKPERKKPEAEAKPAKTEAAEGQEAGEEKDPEAKDTAPASPEAGRQDDSPKASASQGKNGPKRTIRKGETPVAAALRDAGLDPEKGEGGQRKRASSKGKGDGRSRSSEAGKSKSSSSKSKSSSSKSKGSSKDEKPS